MFDIDLFWYCAIRRTRIVKPLLQFGPLFGHPIDMMADGITSSKTQNFCGTESYMSYRLDR